MRTDDPATGDGPVTRLPAAIPGLARRRGPAGGICPSDAARAVGGERWRDLMADTRAVALALARAGEVDIMQRGAVVDPDRPIRGPIRIRIRIRSDSPGQEQ